MDAVKERLTIRRDGFIPNSVMLRLLFPDRSSPEADKNYLKNVFISQLTSSQLQLLNERNKRVSFSFLFWMILKDLLLFVRSLYYLPQYILFYTPIAAIFVLSAPIFIILDPHTCSLSPQFVINLNRCYCM